jgi:hypothetical protein
MTASISSSPNRSACVVLAETSRRSLPLTLPPLSAHAWVRLSGGASPMRQGSLPLPPKGRRGVL